MALEWSTRLERETAIAEVVAAAAAVADRLLWPGAGGTLAVSGGSESDRPLAEVLDARQNPDDGDAGSVSVALAGLNEGWVSLTVASCGRRADGPEFGRFAYVDCGRTRDGVALGVCCAIAAAMCGGSLVWDEARALGSAGEPTGFHDPVVLATAFAPDEPALSPHAAVSRLLAFTAYADFSPSE